MKRARLFIIFAALLVAACGNRNEAQSPSVNKSSTVDELNTPTKAAQSTSAVTTASSDAQQQKNSAKSDVSGKSSLSREEGLALAGKSGCLACHKIETKLVGPAWRDVSKRYQGDAGAKARLVAKVKAGGKGNWTEVTGGIPMPPNSPQVSDENIEKLVAFILSQ